MNTITIVGNLGHDPEVVTVGQKGTAVTTISVATTDRRADPPRTDWHRVVVWAATAEAVGQYLGKGSKVAITGSLRYRTWTDRDGVKHTVAEIHADQVEFLDSKKDRGRDQRQDRGRDQRQDRGRDQRQDRGRDRDEQPRQDRGRDQDRDRDHGRDQRQDRGRDHDEQPRQGRTVARVPDPPETSQDNDEIPF